MKILKKKIIIILNCIGFGGVVNYNYSNKKAKRKINNISNTTHGYVYIDKVMTKECENKQLKLQSSLNSLSWFYELQYDNKNMTHITTDSNNNKHLY